MSGLFWRVFAVNACFLALVAVLLIVTPVTISAPIAITEAALVVLCLAIALLANAVLLRRVFTPLERDVLEYAEAMSQTPPTVTDELVERLDAELGPAAVVELTSVIAFANMSTRGNVALGIESDGFAAACGLKPLAERPGVASAS